MLTQVLHPHRKLEELAIEAEYLPSAHPALSTPRAGGRVPSPWVSMTLHFGEVNIKPIGLPSSECAETSGTTSKEAGKGTGLFWRCHSHLPEARAGHSMIEQQHILSHMEAPWLAARAGGRMRAACS